MPCAWPLREVAESVPKDLSEAVDGADLNGEKMLTAPVPKPRVNLTHFHGVVAPNSKQHIGVVEKFERLLRS